MAKKFFSFEVEGLSDVLRGLDKFEKAVQKEVDAELSASADKIARDAKRAVPVDTGLLKNAISHVDEGELNHSVVAQTKYAVYVEAGTGGLVDVPAGTEDYFMQFKGKGIRQVNLPPSAIYVSGIRG